MAELSISRQSLKLLNSSIKPLGVEKMKIGDIVTLKTGGPQMGIESLYSAEPVNRWICVWFKEGIGHQRLVHTEDELTLVGAEIKAAVETKLEEAKAVVEIAETKAAAEVAKVEVQAKAVEVKVEAEVAKAEVQAEAVKTEVETKVETEVAKVEPKAPKAQK
jgi:uncharacterized protein YodC (DUF2158 family)